MKNRTPRSSSTWFFPLPLQEVHCQNLIKFLEETSNIVEPLRQGPPGVLNPQTCPWEPPAIHHLRLRASYPSAGLPGRFYSSRL